MFRLSDEALSRQRVDQALHPWGLIFCPWQGQNKVTGRQWAPEKSCQGVLLPSEFPIQAASQSRGDAVPTHPLAWEPLSCSLRAKLPGDAFRKSQETSLPYSS